ncbi:MAG: hybrid sensor histidine kinase/response regulator [Rhizobacter sp.]
MANIAGPSVLPSADTESQVRQELMGAEVRRLYDNAGTAAAAAFITAACFWVFYYHHTHSATVLVWALVMHLTQAARLGLLLSFRRQAGASLPAIIWLERYRLALLTTAVAWGLAPVLFLPPADVAYAAMMMLVLLGIAVGGVATIATDRVSVYLWLLPVVTPLTLALIWHNSPTYLGLAVLTVTFTAVNLRVVLGQNHLLSTMLRAQFENAALVQQLHQQMELTAQASRAKSQFLASASHDLRQPLHALSFFGATLERRMAGSVDQPLIHNMMRSIEALDKSFGAILDISKLDAGAVEPHIQSFPVRDLFRRLQMAFAGQAEEAGLQLRFRPAGKVVTSDPHLLERILGNLVQNALRYCKAGGGVLVGARDRRGGVSLEVWDSGIGISEHELPRIFAEFYQVANPERDRSKGLGMGLAIVERLARLLGHELTVTSKPGIGSVFRVWVERSHPEQLDEFAVGAETLPGPLEDNRTVLLIDDEEAIRTSVGELLTEWGYVVITTPTIADAVEAARAREGAIDIVISDQRLRQGEDGLRAIEQVRQACGFDVPALLVTGDTAPDQVLRVHESGYIVLYKPVQATELLTVLKRLA